MVQKDEHKKVKEECKKQLEEVTKYYETKIAEISTFYTSQQGLLEAELHHADSSHQLEKEYLLKKHEQEVRDMEEKLQLSNRLLTKRVKGLEEERQTLLEENNVVASSLQQKEKELDELTRKQTEMQKRVQDLEQQLSQAKESLTELHREVKLKKSEIWQLTLRHALRQKKEFENQLTTCREMGELVNSLAYDLNRNELSELNALLEEKTRNLLENRGPSLSWPRKGTQDESKNMETM